MKRLVIGIRKQFVEDFINDMKKLGINICGDPWCMESDNPFEIWHVMVQPIGKEQNQKYEEYIEYRCNNNLM